MVGRYKSTADVTLRFLKHEEGKDKVIFRLHEGGLFERGNFSATTITVSGPTTFKALVGKWAYNGEFPSESFIRTIATISRWITGSRILSSLLPARITR